MPPVSSWLSWQSVKGKAPFAPAKLPSKRSFESFAAVISYTRNAPGFQVVLARNFFFALFISVLPALMPVVGLKVLHLNSSNLGLLFTSMGAGSVVGAVFILPWLRARVRRMAWLSSPICCWSWFTC